MLVYHWANAHYDFASRLDVPVNQWVFVALVIEPEQATLYLNDGTGMLTATNVAAHGIVPFSGITYVGRDSEASANRRFNGLIDEAMIFGRSLSLSEIQGLYQAAVMAPVRLQITQASGQLTLTWPQGKLLEATALSGPWTTNTAAASPYVVTPAGAKKFYRVQVE